MRLAVLCALLAGAMLPTAIPAAHAASVPAGFTRPADATIKIAGRRYTQERDCTPYNGPFGFYGNIWCQPPNEMSYLRNLGASWPMNRPESLKAKKPSQARDW
jgi:hypothetical protein